jgi:succinate dehydrogenase / fumarate reductase cytochrome b subunit
MTTAKRPILSTLTKKYLMALTGLGLVAFVLVHMLGNLQIFLGPEAINAYAYKLHSLPPAVLWGFRLGLLAIVAVHVWMAILLTIENRKAQARITKGERIQRTYSATTMRISGFILLAFLIFHLLHFTVRIVPENYNATVGASGIPYYGGEKPVFDVFTMMVSGFESWFVSLFYLIAMGLLCMHLAHGFSSMFQSLGIRNETWRYRLGAAGRVYAALIFVGFAVIPLAVLLEAHFGVPTPLDFDHYDAAVVQYEAQVATGTIGVPH